MNNYEGMFIIKSNMDKESKKKLIDTVSAIITKENGVIKDFAEWGKNRLAYKIKKQNDGLYFLAHFSLPQENLQKLQKVCNLNENILKMLITIEEEIKKPEKAV